MKKLILSLCLAFALVWSLVGQSHVEGIAGRAGGDGAGGSGGVLGIVKLENVGSDAIGAVAFANGPFDPLTTGYELSSGVLTATFTTSVAGDYVPQVMCSNPAIIAKVQATGGAQVAVRFYDSLTQATADPGDVYLALLARSE